MKTIFARTLIPLLLVGAICSSSVIAGPEAATIEPVVAGEAEAVSVYDQIWAHTKLYENEDNRVIQNFLLTGRLQADAAFFDAGQGDYEKLLWRRFRFGFKSSIFQDFTLHAEAEFDLNNLDTDDIDDAYGGLTDAYLSWSPGEAITLKVGKQSAGFTLDGATSSKKLITLERSTVATNLWFPTEYFTGITGHGEIGAWTYNTGVFSGSGDDGFGSFDSGYFGLVSLGYGFEEQTGLDACLVRLDYVYNDPDYSGNVGTRDLEHVLSLASKIEQGAAGVWANLSFGSGIGDQSDLLGLQVMPYYNINDKWQLAFRYTLVTSSDDNGVRLNRYESRIEDGRSDKAHEFFLGLNWYLYGHKLKWQNGVEYTTASDAANDGGRYNGWGLTSGIRISW
jgi:phosphate-selective porin OprO/OprP